MRVSWTIVALMSLSYTTFGASLESIEPDTIHVGDHIVARVKLGNVPSSMQPCQFQNIGSSQGGLVCNLSFDTLEFKGFVANPGVVTLGPFTYTDASGHERREAAITLPVQGRQLDGTYASLRALQAANEAPVIVFATVGSTTAYVGQRVLVQWWAAGNFDSIWMDRIGSVPIHVPGFEPGLIRDGDRTVSPGPVDGQYVDRILLAEATLQPNAEGTYSIPALEFFGGYPRRLRNGLTLDGKFRRIAAPISINVLPTPNDARGPIGKFSLVCGAATLEDDWPTFTVELTGESWVSEIRPPWFIAPAPVTVVAVPVEQKFENGRHLRRWVYEVHVRDRVELPRLIFPFFDAEASRNTAAACESVAIPPPDRPVVRASKSQDNPQTMNELGTIAALAVSLFVVIRVFLERGP